MRAGVSEPRVYSDVTEIKIAAQVSVEAQGAGKLNLLIERGPGAVAQWQGTDGLGIRIR